MKTYQITGLGPQAEDGSRDIFTIQAKPYRVSQEWLNDQVKEPEVGDEVVEDGGGHLTLKEMPQNVSDDDVAQKKTDGWTDFGDGSGLKTYVANPIEVLAGQIVEVGELAQDGSLPVTLEDRSVKVASASMLSRITPRIGDYWVIQSQGEEVYEYLNPQDVFNLKYSLKH